jgi:FtsZ-binding cell division protein ZapB
MQDLGKLQKENPKNKTQKLFDQAELGSDSEDQMDETENEWAKRLRQLVLRIRDV